MGEPISFLAGVSSGAAASITLARFIITLKNCPEDVKTCFNLVQRVDDDTHYVIALRTRHRELLLSRQVEATRIDSIINTALASIKDVAVLVERLRADVDGKSIDIFKKLRWIAGDSSSFAARTTNLQAQHAAILNEMTFLRNLDMVSPITEAFDSTTSFDFLDLLCPPKGSSQSTVTNSTPLDSLDPSPPFSTTAPLRSGLESPVSSISVSSPYQAYRPSQSSATLSSISVSKAYRPYSPPQDSAETYSPPPTSPHQLYQPYHPRQNSAPVLSPTLSSYQPYRPRQDLAEILSPPISPYQPYRPSVDHVATSLVSPPPAYQAYRPYQAYQPSLHNFVSSETLVGSTFEMEAEAVEKPSSFVPQTKSEIRYSSLEVFEPEEDLEDAFFRDWKEQEKESRQTFRPRSSYQ